MPTTGLVSSQAVNTAVDYTYALGFVERPNPER